MLLGKLFSVKNRVGGYLGYNIGKQQQLFFLSTYSKFSHSKDRRARNLIFFCRFVTPFFYKISTTTGWKGAKI